MVRPELRGKKGSMGMVNGHVAAKEESWKDGPCLEATGGFNMFGRGE